MRQSDGLVILFLVILCYGLIPIGGAFFVRRQWRLFRRRFDQLRFRPLLNYALCRQAGEEGLYRFTGGFESLTSGQTIWVRSDDLTIPVELSGAQTYLLPGGDDLPALFDPGEEVPERIRWEHISTLAGGTKVFVGGILTLREGRPCFVSTPDHPLLVIFYDCSDRTLTFKVIRAGRHRNEYFNAFTPFGIILGAFSLLLLTASFVSRPALRQAMVFSLVVLFTPLFPLLPPGILFTAAYRRLWWRARILRACRDLVRLPLGYFSSDFSPGSRESFPKGTLPDGETYIVRRYRKRPKNSQDIPFIIPENMGQKRGDWFIFGGDAPGLPQMPRDPFAVYGAIQGNPERMARTFARRAHLLEISSWCMLLLGIGVNGLFIMLLLSFLKV